MSSNILENRIGLVTGNSGKLKEIKGWLEPIGYEVVLLEREFVEVQADTLEEVILFGMEHLRRTDSLDVPFIKDDSGLFIDELDGFPGVYSSYVQRTISNKGILELMSGTENRKARFKTVVGLWLPGKGTSLFRGSCRGSISLEERGKQGFGFDPIFIPEGDERTFAEMPMEEKNSMSHRIKAVMKLVDFIKSGRAL